MVQRQQRLKTFKNAVNLAIIAFLAIKANTIYLTKFIFATQLVLEILTIDVLINKH